MSIVLAPSFSAPDPAAPATDLVYDLGGQVLDVAVDLAPVAVPFVLALGAIAWCMERFGVNGRIELARLDREAAAKEAARVARANKRAAAKQRRWDAMLEDAYAENRRHDLRRRFRRAA